MHMHGIRYRWTESAQKLRLMEGTSSSPRPANSNAIARARDSQIRSLLEAHPATALMLVEAGFFPSVTRARKRLRRLVQKKELRIAGTVSLKDGRPQHVYCRCRWLKVDNLVHEIQVSRICFKMHADEVHRGPREVDSFLRPDAELVIRGRRYLLEFDNGTMSYQALVLRRFEKYRFSQNPVLWVCVTPFRAEGLRTRGGVIGEIGLFTTLDLVVQNPHGAIWRTVEGRLVALPRGGKRAP
jgi:hypothetical protein